MKMTLVEFNRIQKARAEAAAMIEAEAERDGQAIRQAGIYRIKPHCRRRDSRSRTRPRPAA